METCDCCGDEFATERLQWSGRQLLCRKCRGDDKMKDESNLIKRVVLDVGGTEVTVTLEQARKLHAALNELFQQPPRWRRIPPLPPVMPWYPPPYYGDPQPPVWNPGDIICGPNTCRSFGESNGTLDG